MAKDGTNRGGRRVRAGDKSLPLADKIMAGKAVKILEVLELHPESMLEAGEIDDAADLCGEEMADIQYRPRRAILHLLQSILRLLFSPL